MCHDVKLPLPPYLWDTKIYFIEMSMEKPAIGDGRLPNA